MLKLALLDNHSLETPQVISPAFAQAAGAGGVQDALSQFLPLIAMFAILYFLMIRPQMKKAKEHKALIAGLQKGDEVITQGGLTGKVTAIGDNYVKIEVGTNNGGPVEITVQRPAIGIVLPKGTLGSL
jgi:preprotein translocase subunit YajC